VETEVISSRAARTLPAFLSAFWVVGLLTAQDSKQLPAIPSKGGAFLQVDSKGEAKSTTRVEDAGVVSETQGVDFHPYLESRVLPLIRATWYRLASKSVEKVGGDATLQFTILKDGGVSDVQVTDGAGHAALADLAMDAVKKSGPFAGLPAEFSGQTITVRTRFRYEPDASLQTFGPNGGRKGTVASVDCGAGAAPPSGEGRLVPLNPENAVPPPCAAQSPQRTVVVNGVAEPVYQTGKGVTMPRVIYNPEPEFSEEARKKQIAGVVVLSMVVTSEGNTDQIKVTHGIGHGLDEKAVEAVRKWTFQPATKDGQPVSVEIAVEVDFHLYNR
jgi:TonB family protein